MFKAQQTKVILPQTYTSTSKTIKHTTRSTPEKKRIARPPPQGLRQDKEDKNAAKEGESPHDDEGQGQPDTPKGGNWRSHDASDSSAQ